MTARIALIVFTGQFAILLLLNKLIKCPIKYHFFIPLTSYLPFTLKSFFEESAPYYIKENSFLFECKECQIFYVDISIQKSFFCLKSVESFYLRHYSLAHLPIL